MAYAFPDKSTLSFGSPRLLRSAIERAGKKSRRLDTSLQETLARTDGSSCIWLVAKPNAVFDTRRLCAAFGLNSELSESIGSIDYASLFMEPRENGFLTSLLAHTSTHNQADMAHTYLDDKRQYLLQKEGVNVFQCSFLLISEVKSEDSFVRWDTHLTNSSLLKLCASKVVLKSLIEMNWPASN